MIYQLRYVGENGPVTRTSPNKKAAREDAKDLIETGETEELAVLDDKGQFVWYVTSGVSDKTRDVGGQLAYFSDEWPSFREWRDVVGAAT